MPCGLIHDDNSVGFFSNRERNFFQMQFHRMGIAFWHDKPCGFTLLWADRSKDIGRAGPQVLYRFWTCATFGPTSGLFILLPDPGFILPPDFYGLAKGFLILDFNYFGWEVFFECLIGIDISLTVARTSR